MLDYDIDKIKDISADLVNVERESAINSADLSDKIQGLGRIAKGRPTLVERLVNKASRERVRCFALATGSVAEENEINKTCPHLLVGEQE